MSAIKVILTSNYISRKTVEINLDLRFKKHFFCTKIKIKYTIFGSKLVALYFSAGNARQRQSWKIQQTHKSFKKQLLFLRQ